MGGLHPEAKPDRRVFASAWSSHAARTGPDGARSVTTGFHTVECLDFVNGTTVTIG
jgi:hypothetical protein